MLVLVALTATAQPRPGPQNVIQRQVYDAWSLQAKTDSDKATHTLMDYLGNKTFRKEIDQWGLGNYSTQELLGWLEDEIRASPLITTFDSTHFHNITKLEFLPNKWELQVRGEGHGNTIMETAETKLMNFPAFKSSMHPDNEEAETRPVYTALNFWRRTNGFPRYGDTSFVLRPSLRSRVFLAPLDTGHFVYFCMEQKSCSDCDCHAWGNPGAFGTFENFHHLILTHQSFYKYPLSLLIKRLVGKQPAVSIDWYYEGEYAGGYLLPEALHYTIANFEALWGNSEGEKWRLWHKTNRRTIMWSSKSDADHLFVDAHSAADGVLVNAEVSLKDLELHDKLWKQGSTYMAVYTQMPPKFQFRFPNGMDMTTVCPAQSKGVCGGEDCELVGVGGDGRCLWSRDILNV